MEWVVNTKQGKVKLTDIQVIQLLSEEVAKNHKPDIYTLVGTGAGFLETNRTLTSMTVGDLVHFGWMMGYYYSVFLNKNKVDIRSPNEPNSTTDGSVLGTPDGESRGNPSS